MNVITLKISRIKEYFFLKLKLTEDLYYEKINNFNYESINNGFIC